MWVAREWPNVEQRTDKPQSTQESGSTA